MTHFGGGVSFGDEGIGHANHTERKEAMEELLRARLIAQGIARRGKAILLLSEGASLRSGDAASGLNPRHSVKWRERFAAHGLEGLVDQPRSGRRQ